MLPRRKGLIVFIAALILVAIPFLPVTDERTIRDGTDAYGAHHAIWGKRTKSVTETAVAPIRDFGLILVNLRRAQSLAPVDVQVTTKEGGVVGKSTVELLPNQDDEFTWLSFDAPIVQPGESYTVTVSAPSAPEEFPIGARFDKVDKQLALSVRERIPLWKYTARWIEGHTKRFLAASNMILLGSILTAIFLLLEYIATKNKKMGITIALLLLASLTLYIRIPLSQSLESAYGGDALNYILKGNAWIVGEDPFAADARKAPLYSFLVTPGMLPGLDPILWGRGISILAAMGTVVLVSLFLLRVGAPLSLALGGGLLLSINRDYQFESIQGLSNPLFAFLILAAAYAFTTKRTYLVSVCTALAALTRYEGAAAAGILIPAAWLSYPSKLKGIVRDAIPFVILVAIPFLLTPLTGNMGVRTVSDLTGDEGLYIAYSWEYFLPSIKAFEVFFGRLWILTPGVGEPLATFGYGAILAVVGIWFFRRYGHPRTALAIFPALLCAALILGTLWGDGSETKFFITLFSGLAGFGAAAACMHNFRVYFPIVLMALSQAVVITAILPKNRYYLHILPFIAIAIAGAVWTAAGAKQASRTARVVAVGALSLMIAFVYANADEALSGQLSDYNEKSVEQTIEIQAGRYLKKMEGKAAVYEGIDLPIRAYLPSERIVYFPEALQDTRLQYAKMKESGAVFVVDTTGKPYFTALIEAMPEQFEKLATFTTKWGDVSSSIYRVY